MLDDFDPSGPPESLRERPQRSHLYAHFKHILSDRCVLSRAAARCKTRRAVLMTEPVVHSETVPNDALNVNPQALAQSSSSEQLMLILFSVSEGIEEAHLSATKP